MIVAVYHNRDGSIEIVAPCGMCREMISDYAPTAEVIVPDASGRTTKAAIASLLPGKYRRSE